MPQVPFRYFCRSVDVPEQLLEAPMDSYVGTAPTMYRLGSGVKCNFIQSDRVQSGGI